MKKWYAVYTKPSWEKKVATAFRKKQLAHYLPLVPLATSRKDGNRKNEEPLFPSCVFVKLDPDQCEEASRVAGVLSYLHWIDQPATFADAEIEMIVRFLEAHSSVHVQKVSVRMTAARFSEAEVGGVNSALLDLPSFGYVLSAALPQPRLVRSSLFSSSPVAELEAL